MDRVLRGLQQQWLCGGILAASINLCIFIHHDHVAAQSRGGSERCFYLSKRVYNLFSSNKWHELNIIEIQSIFDIVINSSFIVWLSEWY